MSQSLEKFVFFLHQTRGGVRVVPDREGEEFASSAQARSEAVILARQQMAQTLERHGYIDLGCSFEIADEAGATIDTVTFASAVDVRR